MFGQVLRTDDAFHGPSLLSQVISVLRQHRRNLEKVTTRGEAHYIEVFTVNERGSATS